MNCRNLIARGTILVIATVTAHSTELTGRQQDILTAMATVTVFGEDCPSLVMNNDTLGALLLAHGLEASDFDPSGKHHASIVPSGIKAKAERATVRQSQRCDYLRDRYGAEGSIFAGLVEVRKPQFDALAKRWFEELKSLHLRMASATARRDKADTLDVLRESYKHFQNRKLFNVPDKGACTDGSLALVSGALFDEEWNDARRAASLDSCQGELAR